MELDKETAQTLNQQKLMAQIVSHDGWKVIEKLFADEIMELQNAFNIEARRDREIAIELSARKISAKTLQGILETIIGMAQEKDLYEEKNDYLINEENG